MDTVISAAAELKNWDVIITSYNYKLNNIPEMDGALKKANEAGIVLLQ